MKTSFIYCLILLALPFAAYEQGKSDTLPSYLKESSIPPLNILKTDSVTHFTNADLPKNMPVAIIYFNPDCSHCQFEAKEMASHMDSLSNIFFVWVSYAKTMIDMRAFANKYGLSKFKNVVFGQDEKYFIPAYYKIAFTPYMAMYDTHGKITKEFREGAKTSEILEGLQ